MLEITTRMLIKIVLKSRDFFQQHIHLVIVRERKIFRFPRINIYFMQIEKCNELVEKKYILGIRGHLGYFL